MIPKIIHYCWFGKNKIPRILKRYIKTWKKYCPDYEIKLWNENNYDINKIKFMAQAAAVGKWAFVSDYVRLDILEEYGGIYLDTDVELLKNLDPLLNYKGFSGFECSDYIAFGLGVGAEPHNPLIKEIKEYYKNLDFTEDTLKNNTGPMTQTRILQKHGLKTDRSEQEIDGFHIFPTEYFCPMNYSGIYENLTKNSYSVHHFAASWFSGKQKFEYNMSRLKVRILTPIKLFVKKIIRRCKK